MFTCINIAVHEEGELSHQKLLCDYFVSNRCSFVDYVAHNLGEKKNRNKSDTCFGGVGVRGYTFHWQPYWRRYTYH